MAQHWQVYAAHDNVDNLADMAQPPTAPRGIEWPETRTAADGRAVRHGAPYCDLVFGDFITRTTRATLLAQFGLTDAAPSHAVTVRIPDNDDVMRNYNATATLLDTGQRKPGRWEGLTIRLFLGTTIPDPEPEE